LTSRSDVGEDAEEEEEKEVEDEEGLEDELIDSVDISLNLRAKLLEVLNGWMLLGDGKESFPDDEENVKEIHRELQRQAFSMISTLRVFFPVRAKECKYVNKLAYIPSQDTLAGLRKVFEMEGSRIKQQLSTCSLLAAQDIEDGSDVNPSKRSRSLGMEMDSLTLLLGMYLLGYIYIYINTFIWIYKYIHFHRSIRIYIYIYIQLYQYAW
jgi:hypothetical protein